MKAKGELKRFLLALNTIKGMKDSEGNPYARFGGFQSGNETCVRNATAGNDVVCHICFKMWQMPGDDWIDEELARLKPAILHSKHS